MKKENLFFLIGFVVLPILFFLNNLKDNEIAVVNNVMLTMLSISFITFFILIKTDSSKVNS